MPEKARQETIAYHEDYYARHALFDSDSWLARPDQDMMSLAAKNRLYWRLLSNQKPLQILDLGAGVGRNAVPLAQYLQANEIIAQIDCFDVLDSSIDLLEQNSTRYGVDKYINTRVIDNDCVVIEPESYDLILAISVIEHCQGLNKVTRLLSELARGVRKNGYCQIEITTDRSLIDLDTKECLPTAVETTMTEEQVQKLLKEAFKDLNIIKMSSFEYHEDLIKDGKEVHWSSRQTAFLAGR
ncbi:MAG: class I SAM-dependent methyltransferase [Candidatus Obscuribacter sp.]|nr:class I SAM-dependent methyltransferase [Candidatus Obscuribacter sp.]